MKYGWEIFCFKNCLLQCYKNKIAGMVFPNPAGNYLAGHNINNGYQIPEFTLEFKKADIRTPDLICPCRMIILNEIVIGMVRCGFGTVMVSLSSRRLNPEFIHHPQHSFVIDL